MSSPLLRHFGADVIMSHIGGDYAQHWFKGIWIPGYERVKRSKIIRTEVNI